MALYTPFMGEIGRRAGARQRQADMGKMAQGAYMGDQNALRELYGVNPDMAHKISTGKREQEQLNLVRAQKSQDRKRKVAMENRELITDISTELAKMPFDQAQAYAREQAQKYGDVLGEVGSDLAAYDQEDHQQVVSAFGDGAGGTFAGTGMSAQVGNIITKGVDNPEYRSTPEYRFAWQQMNEPKIQRTPTGDMLIYPTIDPAFLPPDVKTKVEEQDLSAKDKAVKTSRTIEGTGKLSTDQKDYNKKYSGLKNTHDAMTNYMELLGKYGPEMSIGQLNAKSTKELQGAHTRLMLDMKTAAELGALQKPDIELMNKLLGNPIGVEGFWTGKEGLTASAQEAMKLITDRHSALNDISSNTNVELKNLGKKGAPKVNRENLSVNKGGQIYQFPDEQSLNEYLKAIGQQ